MVQVDVPSSPLVEAHEDTAIELAEIHAERDVEIATINAETEQAAIAARKEGTEEWQEQTAGLRANLDALGETVLAMAEIVEGLVTESTPQALPEPEAGETLAIVEPMAIISETPTEGLNTDSTESQNESPEEKPEAREENHAHHRPRARMI
jgi:hypothetical protein